MLRITIISLSVYEKLSNSVVHLKVHTSVKLLTSRKSNFANYLIKDGIIAITIFPLLFVNRINNISGNQFLKFSSAHTYLFPNIITIYRNKVVYKYVTPCICKYISKNAYFPLVC